MSEHPSPTAAAGDPVTLETGLEALQSSPEFRGPVEPIEDHTHANDHFALIYESQAEQFAAAIPFIHQGLERGERCLYIADENSKEEALKAMRARGIDVDPALESGALSVQTKQDTYLRGDEFDRDAMLEFWEHSLEQATDEDGYTGIRATAEMTWALEGDTSPDLLAEYEAVLNDLYEDEDYAVLCQYNRERFPAAVIHDVIRTHPHLIHDSVVYNNVYYEPPEEFFEPVQPANEVDRKLGTLRERTETKMELKQRREHFEQVFESSHDAIFIVDPEADEVIDANPAASKMLGYSRDELLSRGPSDFHPDERDRFDAFVDEVFEDGSGWTDELTCRTKDRSRIPAEISASQIEYDDRPVLLAAVRDITERKRREQLLVEQKELLERIASGAPLEECLSALCTAVSRLNSGVRASILLADDEREAFEHPIAPDLSPSWGDGLEDAPINDLMIGTCGEAVFRGEPITCEDVANDDRWSTEWRDLCVANGVLAGHSEPIQDADGIPEGSFMLCFDEPRAPNEWEQRLADFGTHVASIALERDRSRQALRERTEHLSALIETTPDCIKTVAADGTLLQMNPAGLDMVEADSASDVTGGCVYDLIAPEHRERFREFNERICRGERGTLEFDLIGLEGTRRHMETHAAPLHRPDGTTAQVALTRDITDRKEREERLEQKTDRLESFASMLAHELRNPTMIGQIYSQELPDDTDSEAVEYVMEAFDRIENMIDVMLVLTRGREAVDEPTSVDLAAVAEQVWADVDAPDATLDIEIDDIIEADETYIQHLFRNLLENTVEHGGADVAVTVGDLSDGFYVADDGPGIPPEDRDAVFDEGYTTAAESGGTGLGLAFVQKLAEVYNWDYDISDSEAGGARFEFHIV